jgi:hypothetical protein
MLKCPSLSLHFRTFLVMTTVLAVGTLRISRAEERFSEQIDRIIDEACRRDGTKLASLSDDAEFVRRVHLDLVGVVPTVKEVKAFLDDSACGKRARLVDRLQARPEFALQMARVFDAMLIERRIATIRSYDIETRRWRDWLGESFRQNKPWDQLSREILSSEGTNTTNGAAAKFYLVRDVEAHLMARDIGRLMLGTNLQCAQCHDDPRIEAYHQADYYGLYAFVSRLKHFRDDEKKLNYVTEKAKGDVSFTSAFTGTQGETNPRLPGGKMIADPPLEKDKEYKIKPEKGRMGVPAYSRRATLAEFLPRRETKGFSRNIANRVWSVMLGRGIVHPLDMHHPDNPPSHPKLLRLLADRLEETDYDIRGMLCEIALTRAYQRSSRLPDADQSSPPDPSRFAVAALRPLSPEQLGWSVLQVTGWLPSRLERTERKMKDAAQKETQQKDANKQETEDSVEVKRKNDANPADLDWQVHKKVYGDLQPELETLFSVFSRLPGQPNNGFQPSVDQALFLLNSEQMVKFMKESTLLDRLSHLEKPGKLADELYLAVLSRRPTDQERAEVERLVEGAVDRKQRYEVIRRIVWGQLVSAEFRLNH